MPAILHHVSHPLPVQDPVATRLAAPERLRPNESWCSNRRGIGPELPLRPFFSHGPRRVLVCPDRRAIQHQALQIRVSKRSEHLLPNASFCPAIKSLKHGVPVAKTLRQVAPGRTCSRHPNDGVHKQTVVFRMGSWAPFPAWQQRFNLSPLHIRKFIASCCWHPCHPFYWGSNATNPYKLRCFTQD